MIDENVVITEQLFDKFFTKRRGVCVFIQQSEIFGDDFQEKIRMAVYKCGLKRKQRKLIVITTPAINTAKKRIGVLAKGAGYLALILNKEAVFEGSVIGYCEISLTKESW